jgi:uncharacterized protein YjiS (DUF1127 family)
MYTALGAAELKRATKPTQRVSNFLGSCWGAFQQWRKRDRLRTELYGLNDRELMDIGTTRGEIDYVASHRGIDPRGIRSGEWLRYLPTVDGQILPTDFR